jgi:hypothetical protein
MESDLILQDGTVVSSNNRVNTSQITYNSALERTIAQNTLINNLTCGNINTAHLTSATSSLQAQINSLQSQINVINSTYVPTGCVFCYAKSTPALTGYLMCHGDAVSQTTYAALFAVIENL